MFEVVQAARVLGISSISFLVALLITPGVVGLLYKFHFTLNVGGCDGTRTRDLPSDSGILYQSLLHIQVFTSAGAAGFAPTTYGLTDRCSAD